MANPLLTSAVHGTPTDLVLVAFDQAMETQGDHSALAVSSWRVLVLATGLPVAGLTILAVGEDPDFGDGQHFRITFDGALADGVGYQAEASGTIWSAAGDPVAGGAGDTANFLGVELDAAEDHFLPSLFLGRVTESNPGAATPVILNETPESNSPFADKATWISFEAFHSTGISLADTVVTVNGVIVRNGLAWEAGWEGYEDTLPGSGVRFTFRRVVAFDPDEDVEVVLEILPVVGALTSYTWRFSTAEETAPVPTSVASDGLTMIRVEMSEAVLAEDAGGATDALNPANWVITGVPQLQTDRYIPANEPTVASVLATSATGFLLTLDAYLSPDGLYVLNCENIVDLAYPVPNTVLSGDPASIPDLLVSDEAVLSGLDAGQMQFTVLGRRPHYNLYLRAANEEDRRGDDISGDLRRIFGVLQDQFDIGMMLADSYPAVLEDPDTAPEEWLDLILADMGNPFHWLGLDVAKKRILAVNLWYFYSMKGVAAGIEAAVRFLFDLDPVTVVPSLTTTMTLGSWGGDAGVGDGSELGTDEWILGPSGLKGKFSFGLEVPVVLDAETKKKVRWVVNWMKRAEEHFVNFIEPAVPEDVDHWELGMSDLDVNTDLH